MSTTFYQITATQQRANDIASAVGAGVAGLCALFLLISALYIRLHPSSARLALNRLSFRLLLWCMGMEVIYSGLYVWQYALPGVYEELEKTKACTAGVYFLFGSLGAANWLCTCIAVNLMLTVVFRLDPLKLQLERWYILGSLVIGFGAPLVPAILGHFGPDPLYRTCFLVTVDSRTRTVNLVMDLYLWQCLSCLVAFTAVIMVLVCLFRQSRATATTSANFSAWNPGGSTKLCIASDGVHLHHLEDRFTVIALRVSLYPITLIVVNGIIMVGDLYFTAIHGIHSNTQYRFSCIHRFLWGGRGIFFALLGIFLDPVLRKGFGDIRASNRESKQTVSDSSTQTPYTENDSLNFKQALLHLDDPDRACGSYLRGDRGALKVSIAGGQERIMLGQLYPVIPAKEIQQTHDEIL